MSSDNWSSASIPTLHISSQLNLRRQKGTVQVWTLQLSVVTVRITRLSMAAKQVITGGWAVEVLICQWLCSWWFIRVKGCAVCHWWRFPAAKTAMAMETWEHLPDHHRCICSFCHKSLSQGPSSVWWLCIRTVHQRHDTPIAYKGTERGYCSLLHRHGAANIKRAVSCEQIKQRKVY